MISLARRATLCAAAAGVLLLATVSGPAAAATYVVVIDQMKYGSVPPLKRGDRVEFVNKDLFRHTVTAANNSFNLDIPPGKRAALRINSVGRAAFYCKYHPGMRGIMIAK